MARIEGVDLPRNKRIEIALTYIYGIGRSRAQEILEVTGVDNNKRVHELSDEDVAKLRKVIDEEYIVEGELRRDVKRDIKRLKDIGCYRGIRHKRGLPVRGQRTQTNARTRKGPKQTVGVKQID